MPEEEITLSVALSYAKSMVNTFRAFKKVEDVLEKTVAAEEYLKANEAELKKVQEEIETLKLNKETYISALETSIAELEEKYQEKSNFLNSLYLIKEKEAQEKIAQLESETSKKLSLLKEQEEDALNACQVVETNFLIAKEGVEKKMKVMVSELSEVQGKIESAKAEMSSLKSRLS